MRLTEESAGWVVTARAGSGYNLDLLRHGPVLFFIHEVKVTVFPLKSYPGCKYATRTFTKVLVRGFLEPPFP